MNLRPPPGIGDLRAALWTVRALRAAWRQLGDGDDYRALDLPDPPPLPASATRGVDATIRRSRRTCLVKASVRQRWHAAHGDRRDLVIGVTPPAAGFKAHAWLDGDAESRDGSFTELTRVPAA
ncbi:MAG TPA: lasso peptide biosynthesis B2 protein [Solirubrobacteraceae bacterium]|nr:lasso peptide biosynthesis B2 protein [Solirubrobacteraceae bacterium]